MMMRTQEQIFTQWTEECQKLTLLNSFIQNDFERMLEDGTTTKEVIKDALVEFRNSYNKVGDNIHSLRVDIEKLMTKFSEDKGLTDEN
jgi:ferritin-like protein